jgi:Carboxypeptidase regulatory-like domain
MRHALLGGLMLVAAMTAACGAYTFPGGAASPTPTTGAVSGRVLAVPCAPVERVGSPCTGKPVAGVEIDYIGGAKVGRTITDAGGNYSIQLEPGTYTVVFKSFMRVVNGPTKITIAAGSSLIANYIVDSGIRAPVPQR